MSSTVPMKCKRFSGEPFSGSKEANLIVVGVLSSVRDPAENLGDSMGGRSGLVRTFGDSGHEYTGIVFVMSNLESKGREGAFLPSCLAEHVASLEAAVAWGVEGGKTFTHFEPNLELDPPTIWVDFKVLGICV